MWDWHDGPNGWGWFWMAFMMALVWVPIVLAGIWLLVRLGRGGQRAGDRGGAAGDLDARELARRAYARGEIDRERFLQTMADLDASERPRHAI